MCSLKLAVSADGKAGLAGRKPVAITGEAARERVFQMRAQSDAILVGIGTVLSDNPQLTCRLPGMIERSPVRVVLDAQLARCRCRLSVVATVRETPTWVFDLAQAVGHRRGDLAAEGRARCSASAIATAGSISAKCSRCLAGEGITRLMVEGGPTVAASFVAADLVDEAALLRADKTGRSAPAASTRSKA